MILSLFEDRPKEGLGALFDKYYDYLSGQVYYILKDIDESEDVVQELFMELWKKHEHLNNIKSSLKNYLKRAAVNRALNKIKTRKKLFEFESGSEFDIKKSTVQPNLSEISELEQVISKSIDELPSRCREVFVLSREQGLSYKEISTELDISVKTVENQIGKALKILRKKVLNE